MPAATSVDTSITLGPDAVVRRDLDPDQPPILSIRVCGFELMLTVDDEPTEDPRPGRGQACPGGVRVAARRRQGGAAPRRT